MAPTAWWPPPGASSPGHTPLASAGLHSRFPLLHLSRFPSPLAGPPFSLPLSACPSVGVCCGATVYPPPPHLCTSRDPAALVRFGLTTQTVAPGPENIHSPYPPRAHPPDRCSQSTVDGGLHLGSHLPRGHCWVCQTSFSDPSCERQVQVLGKTRRETCLLPSGSLQARPKGQVGR